MELDEKFIDKNISELCKNYDIIKGWNVNLCRAATDYIDGLKQVARRLLYIMFLKDNGRTFRKVAAITGDTIARIHMHGPSSVYSCLVGLAQPWNNMIPLIEGYGNFGSVSGDPAGADRYIQARISEYAYDCFFSDWKEAAVDMIMGADGETKEPLYLPAKYPNVLLNGSQGIGYGMATSIPSYNFKELLEATIELIKDPNYPIVLIPDSPTGCSVIKTDFKKITETGTGNYLMRCTYEFNLKDNEIIITSLPYQVPVNSIREKIADLKEQNHLNELVSMHDHSGNKVDLKLTIKSHINPYKFMKKLLKIIPGLEKSYSVAVTVSNDYCSYDMSIKDVLNEWIRYRKEQKRVVISNKRTNLLLEQRINDIKIFIMSGNNLETTINIFKNSRNKKEIEKNLIEQYHDSEIRMDSLQAQALSEMRMYELSKESYEKCLKRRDELIKEINKVEKILNEKDGISKLIIGELNDGIKKYGSNRKSNVIDYEIDSNIEVDEYCILQIGSDGSVLRKIATNVEEEPIPTDSNGFAIRVDNNSEFIVIDEDAKCSFVKVNEIPIDKNLPLNHFLSQKLSTIVGIIPYDGTIESFILVSKFGIINRMSTDAIKRGSISCFKFDNNDKIIKAIPLKYNTNRDILIYTQEGYGQRIDIRSIPIRVTKSSKGNLEILLKKNDFIIGCYAFNQKEKQFLLYVTSLGRFRLNLMKYLPARKNKKEEMVKLIPLKSTEKLINIIGCNQFDKIKVYFTDNSEEELSVNSLEETTMSSDPIKCLKKSGYLSVLKAKLL